MENMKLVLMTAIFAFLISAGYEIWNVFTDTLSYEPYFFLIIGFIMVSTAMILEEIEKKDKINGNV